LNDAGLRSGEHLLLAIINQVTKARRKFLSEHRLSETRLAILRSCAEHRAGTTLIDLASAVGRSSSTVTEALNFLIANGQLSRITVGGRARPMLVLTAAGQRSLDAYQAWLANLERQTDACAAREALTKLRAVL
jgi:DNA-binding MarR family transcriptional regulator